jgi:nucleoside-diphosphate-sugar epimerase
MRILVTGAGGFVGGFLAEGFSAAGHFVVALDRTFDSQARARLAGCTLVEAALGPGSLDGLQPVDLVVHGAAITTSPLDLRLTAVQHIRANCDALLEVLTFAEACGAKDFIALSSSAVFDAPADVDLLVESTPAEATGAYALAKRAGELFLQGLGGGPLRGCSVRLGSVYGPGERARLSRRNVSPVRQWIDQAASGHSVVVTTPIGRRDWTYGPDLADALLALLKRMPAVNGVVHVTSGEAADDGDLAGLIAEHFKVECRIGTRPTAPRRIPMGSERIEPGELRRWTPLRQGLARVLEDRP